MGIGIDKIWDMIGNRTESNRPTNARATVLRKDNDGTIWVKIEGGIDETPVHSTVADVKPNDVVDVRVSGGKAYIEGSTSSPSVGVTRYETEVPPIAKKVERAERDAGAAIESSEASKRAAEEAAEVASAVSQHFWTRDEDTHSDGAGTGAFVTDDTKDDFLDAAATGFPDLSDQNPYHNLLMNSLGLLIRTALRNLVSITRSSIAFFDGLGNNASNIVASFGKDGVQVGTNSSHNLKLSSNSMGIYYGKDRLATFASDADNTEVHLGGSDKAKGVKYTNEEVDEAYEFIRTCHVSDGKIYDSDNNLTPYTLTPYRNTIYRVLDEDMEEFSSGKYNSIFYMVGDEAFYKSRKLSPQTEIPANVGIDVSAFRIDVDKDDILVKFVNDEAFRAVFGNNGAFSSGYGTKADADGQTAIGRYNVEDGNDTYALIIGNGSGEDSRSNALTVDWNGNITTEGVVVSGPATYGYLAGRFTYGRLSGRG